jgi:hypothetical protein
VCYFQSWIRSHGHPQPVCGEQASIGAIGLSCDTRALKCGIEQNEESQNGSYRFILIRPLIRFASDIPELIQSFRLPIPEQER